MWSGELSDNYTAAVSISIATMEEEIIDINVILNEIVGQRFSRTLSCVSFEFPEAWVVSRLDHCLSI